MLLRLLHRVQLLAAHDRAVEACDTEDIAALDLVPLQAAIAYRARGAIVPLRQHAWLDHGHGSVRDISTQLPHVFALVRDALTLGHRSKDRCLSALQ